MNKDSRIYVAGHRGLVGSAIVRKLEREGYTNLILRARAELDLRDQRAVNEFFSIERPEYVFLAAAKVGGIYANATQQAEFLYDNLTIAANVIHAAADHGSEKLLFLSSSCVYPRNAPQPMKEEYLLTAPFEPTNEGYAIAKIAGMKLCEYYNREHDKRFISALPSNVYGPGDNFHPLHSHVIPGMMRRFHEAKVTGASEVIVWGTGKARREFLYVDDLAEALYLLMQKYDEPIAINVGTAQDCTIAELAEILKQVTQFEGSIRYDSTKPDGMPRKLLDTSRISNFDWQPTCSLPTGLKAAYEWAVMSGAFPQLQPVPR